MRTTDRRAVETHQDYQRRALYAALRALVVKLQVVRRNRPAGRARGAGWGGWPMNQPELELEVRCRNIEFRDHTNMTSGWLSDNPMAKLRFSGFPKGAVAVQINGEWFTRLRTLPAQ